MASRSVTSVVAEALKLFNGFIEVLEALDSSSLNVVSVGGWKDELGRFRIWAANIGAHEKNQNSLDYRLRDASHIRGQTIELLNNLVKRLDDAEEVLGESLEVGVDEEILSDDACDDGSDEEETGSEMKLMQESIAAIIGCLFQMSMLLRKPAKKYPQLESHWSEVAMFEAYDIDHVRNKYPKISQAFAMRLGNALTRRRMYLRYRERHAAKLKHTLDRGELEDGATTSNTVPTDSTCRDLLRSDRVSESAISHTSYCSNSASDCEG